MNWLEVKEAGGDVNVKQAISCEDLLLLPSCTAPLLPTSLPSCCLADFSRARTGTRVACPQLADNARL